MKPITINPVRIAALSALLISASLFTDAQPVQAQTVAWPNGPTPARGRKTTLRYGDGSRVDVLIQTAAPARVTMGRMGSKGRQQTGLNYRRLRQMGVFYGGGSKKLKTTITFSNFRPAPNHTRGLLFFGHVNGGSSPITIQSQPAGAFRGWRQVGKTFPVAADGRSGIRWNPKQGQVVTNAPVGNDSSGIIIDVGALQQGGSIKVTLNQFMDDSIWFSLGVETRPSPTCQPDNDAACACNDCGTVTNNCGETVDCGQCEAPAMCGGAGIPNICGVPPCPSCGGGKMTVCWNGETKCVGPMDAGEAVIGGGTCGPCP